MPLKPTTPRRPIVPPGDLILVDGRRLANRGIWRVPMDQAVMKSWATADGMLVTAALEPTQHGKLLHVAISYSNHDPSWADIKAVRAAFYPSTIDVMMVLPQAQDYVNVHEHTFHLWQTPGEWAIR